jgi:hypothetical protein
MPKNIVLCSDGTGNSGGKGYNTNVWRIFNAINHQPRPDFEQATFYDDGVGSQDFKFLRAVGGTFGWGISLTCASSTASSCFTTSPAIASSFLVSAAAPLPSAPSPT